LSGLRVLLENICKKYRDLKPRLVVLFGSYARGDYTDESDIDILVVSDHVSRDPREAFQQLYDPEEPKIMPIGMNTEVFISKLKRGEPFILEIMEDGKVLCKDPEFHNFILKLYKEVRKNYIRRGRTWIRVNWKNS